ALNAFGRGALGRQFADGLGGGHIAAVGSGALIHGRCRDQRGAFGIVDDLDVNVRNAAKHRQTRPLRRARKLAADSLVYAAANFFFFWLTNHFALAPVLPTFLRSTS